MIVYILKKTGYQHFLLLPQCFLWLFIKGVKKHHCVVKAQCSLQLLYLYLVYIVNSVIEFHRLLSWLAVILLSMGRGGLRNLSRGLMVGMLRGLGAVGRGTGHMTLQWLLKRGKSNTSL